MVNSDTIESYIMILFLTTTRIDCCFTTIFEVKPKSVQYSSIISHLQARSVTFTMERIKPNKLIGNSGE